MLQRLHLVLDRRAVAAKMNWTLSKRDELAAKGWKDAGSYFPAFWKKRESLRGFYASQGRPIPMLEEMMKQLEWKQDELVEALSEYIEDNVEKSGAQLHAERRSRTVSIFARVRSERSRDKEKRVPFSRGGRGSDRRGHRLFGTMLPTCGAYQPWAPGKGEGQEREG